MAPLGAKFKFIKRRAPARRIHKSTGKIRAGVVLDIAVVIALGAVGTLGAWLLRRRTTLSVKNLYLAGAIAAVAFGVSVALRAWSVMLLLAPVCALVLAAGVAGRRWRLADLGAGEELRQYELSRRWLWQPAPERQPGERIYVGSQGEIFHERRCLSRPITCR